MLDFPISPEKLNFLARVQKARRQVKAHRRWLRAQRLLKAVRPDNSPAWHPDAHPWDQASR